MTIIASILFLSALAASAFAISITIGNAMPRIRQVVENEFAPAMQRERRINFGPVQHRQVVRTAEVVAFPAWVRSAPEYKLAA
jgi:hypothetical protein